MNLTQVASVADDLPFRWLGGVPCLDFTNTVAWDAGSSPLPQYERLTTYGRLVEWARAAGVLDGGTDALLEKAVHHPDEAEAALQQAIGFRQTLHDLFTSVALGRSAGGSLGALNAMFSQVYARLRIVPVDGGFGWRWVDAESDLGSILWPVVWSAAELLTSNEVIQVRQCSGDPCGFLFLDTSRGHRRRWCDMAHCGNRAKARRHYRRVQRERRPSSGSLA